MDIMQDTRPGITVRDGVRLGHVEAGPIRPRSPALLLVGGWTGDHRIFTPQITHFGRDRRVVAIDLRGHGTSDAPHQDYTVAGFADDIAWQVRALGIEKPLVVGHSMGGMIALELCGRHPALPCGLVMIDSIIAPLLAGDHGPAITALLEGLSGPDYLEVSRRNAWEIGCDHDDPARRRAIFDAYIRGPCEATPQHVAVSALRNALRHDPEPAAARCTVPMAYIAADVPVVAAITDLAWLRRVCPQLVTAKTLLAGHFNTIEVADQVTAMIERFLSVGLTLRAPSEETGLP